MEGEQELLSSIRETHQIVEMLEAFTKQFALDAIEQGLMRQVDAARALEVHPITISRWLTAREVEQTPDTAS